MLSNIKASAIIYYTDIEDVTLSQNGDEYKLDIDNNTSIDFIIQLKYPETKDHNQITVIHKGLSRVGVERVENQIGKLAWSIPAKDSIGTDLKEWMASGSGTPNEIFLAYYANNSMKGGAFLNTEAYIALEFRICMSVHYGWARVSINEDCTSLTIKDFAYEYSPDKAIAAGDMGELDVDKSQNKQKLIISPNPSNNTQNTTLWTTQDINNANIDLFDLNGRIITNIHRGALQANQPIQIDNYFLPKGIYIIKLQSNQYTHSQILIIE